MSNPMEAVVEGLVINPTSFNSPDGQNISPSLGKQSEALQANLHGIYYNAAIRGCLFTFNVTAVTVPVIASGLVSVFSLYNPPNSGKVLELIDIDMANLSGTTVIDVLGLYWMGNPVSGQSTFTTPGVFGTNFFGGVPGRSGASGIPYSALTHLTGATPARVDIINSQNTTTNIQGLPVHYEFKGKRLLYPGDLVSLAASTAAMHTSTTDLGMSWAEWPYPS